MKVLITILCLLTHFSTYAGSVKQKELNFTVNGEELLKGDVYYSVDIISRYKLKQIIPEFLELDTTGFTKPKQATLLVSKSAYVVKKPVGFFDHKKTEDVRYLRHIMGEQKLTELGEQSYKVEIPGGKPLTYKLRLHFDSDDISSTANSRAIRAITGAKKMDIQVQGASSLLVWESWDYSKGSYGAIHVTAYLALKEDRTLVIEYGLVSLIPPLLAKETLEGSVSGEAEARQALIDSFKSE